jgi:hypothetical protein
MRAWLCALVLIAAGCEGEESAPARVAPSAAGQGMSRKTEKGPLVATVEVSLLDPPGGSENTLPAGPPKGPPARAKVGDVLRLTLTVDAQPGVQVIMPPFGDALGRFEVIGYSPREEAHGGGRRHVQDYRLQASRSGRLRIPPLRVEYSTGKGEAQELLTEEIAVEIESVLTADGSGKLGAVRGPLDETVGRSWLVPGLAGGGALLLALAFLAVRARRRRQRAAIRRSASDIAFGRLAALEGRGLPEGRDAVDAWYVELSDIVRRYIEDRFAIRAPELTTEEFLREARRLRELGEPQRAALSAFLEGCDRVKFAAHQPAAEESREALGLARRLVEETAVAAPVAPDPTQKSAEVAP